MHNYLFYGYLKYDLDQYLASKSNNIAILNNQNKINKLWYDYPIKINQFTLKPTLALSKTTVY